MQRIDTSTKAADLFGAGKHGFTDGNPGIGLASTQLNAEWFNQIQEEVAAVVEGAGVSLDPAIKTQLRDALIMRYVMQSSLVGITGWFGMATPPTGWIKANGAAVSRTAYAALFAAIGTTYGAGNGSTTFNVPELRGEFPRGWDDGRGVDTSRTLGTWQKGSLLLGDNGVSNNTIFAKNALGQKTLLGWDSFTSTQYSGSLIGYLSAGTTALDDGEIVNHGGVARPRNLALLACIKY